jgi:hypothetical protein
MHIIILDLTAVFGEEYKLWSSSLWSLLEPSVVSSALGSNILLSTLFIIESLAFL